MLVAASLFALSFVAGIERGLLIRIFRELRMRSKVGEDHLLRGIYEILEARGVQEAGQAGFEIGEIILKRSWSRRHLMRLVKRAEKDEYLIHVADDRYKLTRTGFGSKQRKSPATTDSGNSI